MAQHERVEQWLLDLAHEYCQYEPVNPKRADDILRKIKKLAGEGVCMVRIEGENGYRFFLARHYSVRFFGVDAPEGEQEYGIESQAALIQLISGKELIVHIYEKCPYGRSVGDVYLDDYLTCVQEVLLRLGEVWHYVYHDDRFQFKWLEHEARMTRRGLWVMNDPEYPRNWRLRNRSSESLVPSGVAVVDKYVGLGMEAVRIALLTYGDCPQKVTEFAKSYNKLRSIGIPSKKAADLLRKYDNNIHMAVNHLVRDIVRGAFQCASFTSTTGDGLSRYRADFREIEQIGRGNLSQVFKVVKRKDGCMYAVKQSVKQLHSEADRARAAMEVQALVALGPHQNVIGYYDSWFENQKLFIQMELCDHSMKGTFPMYEEVLQMLYQIARALDFIHRRGIAHLSVKTNNIYVKNGVYKLAGFSSAALLEGGDMPQEILNDSSEHLDKVDIFSLGAATYELSKDTPLPDRSPQFTILRESKPSLFLGCPMQFQSLLTSMMDPNPMRRPSAREVMNNPVFMRKKANGL